MTQKQTIAMFAVLCLIALGLGYLVGQPEKNTQVVPTTITTNVVTAIDWNPILEKAIRKELKKPDGELIKADYEKVTLLELQKNQLTNVTGLEKLTQLTRLSIYDNQLTDVKGLEKLTQLIGLALENNPALTKAQIAELQKALPKCKIFSNATK